MKPILFNTEMVRAILDGRKTATRRVVKPQPAGDGSKPEPLTTRPGYWNTWGDDYVYHQPYQIGDILYVRETWCQYGELDDNDCLKDGTEKYYYRADGENPTPFNDFLVQHAGWDEHREMPVWHPSIHMPKEAARLFLRVAGVRVERLKEMTASSAMDEGFLDWKVFTSLWDKTIKKADLPLYGWNANPWVWVIEFERCEKPERE